jgi:hypothetical protein
MRDLAPPNNEPQWAALVAVPVKMSDTLQQLPQDSKKIRGMDENKNKRKGGWVNWIQPI